MEFLYYTTPSVAGWREAGGLTEPRYHGRAVTAMMDGHVQTMTQSGLQDMRHWANTADRPDFTLQPAP